MLCLFLMELYYFTFHSIYPFSWEIIHYLANFKKILFSGIRAERQQIEAKNIFPTNVILKLISMK